MKGEDNRREREAGAAKGRRRPVRPGGFAGGDERNDSLRSLSSDKGSHNGQFIRGGRSARTRLRPVRAEGLSSRRTRSGVLSWIAIVILVIVIGALVWFFFLRDGNASAASPLAFIVTPTYPVPKVGSRALPNASFSKEGVWNGR